MGGALVPLGGRAFDLLEILVRSAGKLVSKNALMAQLWEGAVVEENSLQFHTSAIRKAFGRQRDILRTVFGRGYRLLGDWTVLPESTPDGPTLIPPTITNLPVAGSALVGRSLALQHLRDLQSSYRIITLTGPGGIGKSKLALEFARSLLSGFGGDVWLVELVSVSDPDLVPSTVAGVLKLKLGGNEISAETVGRAIGRRRLLIVLDNCEHVIEAVARLTATLARDCPCVSIVTTSREMLGVDGENVFRVPSLDVPSPQIRDQDTILQYSAVQLFVARVRTTNDHLELSVESLATIGVICRRLDGIPLAIEFAAARVATLGLQQLLLLLDDRFRLLTNGNRTAPSRHQTLYATLHWSYQLLPETERILLRRLAIFATRVTLEAVVSIVSDATIPPLSVEQGIANLIEKSLVVVDLTTLTTRYSLLETTRTYARERLIESGELELVARRHAEYHRDLFERAEGDLEAQSSTEWLATYGHLVDEVRAALDWAFAPGGDSSTGVALTTVSVSLWMQLTLLAEFRRRLERVLTGTGPGSGPTPRQEMQLLAALGVTLLLTTAPVRQIKEVWKRVREIAEQLEDTRYQLLALRGLWEIALNCCEFQETRNLAEAAYEIALREVEGDNLLVNYRTMGASLHYLGDQAGARQYLERILDPNVAKSYRPRAWGAQINPQVSGRSALSRVLWLQGFPERAARMANSAVAEARASNVAYMLCFAMVWATYPVALLSGDLATAEAAAATLLDVSTEHGAQIYQMWGRRCQATLLVKKGDAEAGVSGLRIALNAFRERGLTLAYTSTLCDLAEALGLTGQVIEGLAAIDEALARCDSTDERWCVAELLRVKGMLFLLRGEARDVAAAEDHFLQGLDWARRQEAMSWELRCATSLAQLWRHRGRGNEARDLLGQVYGRFTEGFATADLRMAKTLINELW
jgi:predicted ATPase